MIKEIKKIRGPVPYEATSLRSGFVILFAVTLSAILLSIALGIANIALKEVKFGTNARDTNNAFFAADTGAELVLFNDKNGIYPAPGVDIEETFPKEIVTGLGGEGTSCAIVKITKDNTVVPMTTTIISKGYNIGDASCGSTNPDRIERELKVTY